MKKKVIFKLLCLGSLMVMSCSPGYYKYLGTEKYISTGNEIDYSNLQNWAAHPRKKDPSDSIPLPLVNEKRDTLVDVFFIHPTTLTDMKRVEEKNALISDDSINIKTDYTSILYQASVFNGSARIYAPRYRQAHIGMFNYKDTLAAKEAFELAYQDVKKAFEYYLKNENKGRPIIIASHSQGTLHAQRILKEYFDQKQNPLVIAYILGLYVNSEQYENIPVCTDSSKTGCLVSWRSFQRNYEGPDYLKKEKNAVNVNPLSWTVDTLLYGKEYNHGAVLFNMKKIIPNATSGQLHKNILWISKPKFPGSFLYTNKNYHIGDVNLYYINIREDVKRRINYYFSQNK